MTILSTLFGGNNIIFELSLNGSWNFKGFGEKSGEELGAHLTDYSADGWLPASVPGTVHLDLMANNVIPDPFKDLNEKKVQWVSDTEWWYRKEVDFSLDVLQRQVVELVFEGLDTFATVWVNGIKVGEANNMFTPWRFNIKNAIREGRNLIAVRFKPIYKAAYELEQRHKDKYACLSAEYCSARPYVRKAQYSFGWDWGPTLPTAGIWRKTKIVAYDTAMLGYFSGLPLEVSKDKAIVRLTAQINVTRNSRLRAKFVLEGFGQKLEREVKADVVAGQNFVDCFFDVFEPKLWWPRGYGEACLYDASVELYCGNLELGRAVVKVGIRRIEVLQEPDEEGVSFVLMVNGLRIFCKGANWVPADSFLPRVTSEQYRRLLGLAAEANVNMLRVWAGGVYEADDFYDLCDALGILVWQDFMYVCAGYPEEEWFLTEAKQEAELALLRLRGHACIALWCGNNENQWLHHVIWKERDKVDHLHGLPIYEMVLSEVCKRLDPTRPYRPSTPYGGLDFNGKHEGHRHNWEVWSHGLDYTAYLDDTGRFLTEFGWQAAPTLELLASYLDKKDLNPRSEAFEAHEKQKGGLELLRGLLAVHYPVPEDLRLFVLYSQLNQADALKTAVTHWRSRMFKTSGCLIWQLNDCWPVVSWSLIDYGLNPKASYYFIKRAFRPIIAALIVKDGKVYCFVVNETSKFVGLGFKFEVLRFNGETIHAEKKLVQSAAYTSQLVLDAALDGFGLADDCVLAVTFESNGVTLCEDSRTVREPKELKLPKPQVTVNVKKVGVGKFEIALNSMVYAKAVYLTCSALHGNFDDNFFDLLPNKPKAVSCQLESDMSINDFEQALRFEAYPYL